MSRVRSNLLSLSFHVNRVKSKTVLLIRRGRIDITVERLLGAALGISKQTLVHGYTPVYAHAYPADAKQRQAEQTAKNEAFKAPSTSFAPVYLSIHSLHSSISLSWGISEKDVGS